MNKDEFLRILREQLSGELEEPQILVHVQYYAQYIGSETAKGYAEEDIIAALGDPRLIAKTLIDTKETASEAQGTYDQESSSGNTENAGPKEKKVRWLDLSTWYGKALMIVIAVVVIALVVTVLSALLPFLAVIFCISILVRYFKGHR